MSCALNKTFVYFTMVLSLSRELMVLSNTLSTVVVRMVGWFVAVTVTSAPFCYFPLSGMCNPGPEGEKAKLSSNYSMTTGRHGLTVQFSELIDLPSGRTMRKKKPLAIQHESYRDNWTCCCQSSLCRSKTNTRSPIAASLMAMCTVQS